MRDAMWMLLTLLLACAVVTGCDGKEAPSASADPSVAGGEAYYLTANAAEPAQPPASRAAASTLDHDAAHAIAEAPTDGRLPVELPPADAARRIIFNADLDLVVDDFAGVPAAVAELARDHGGFVAQSSVYGSAGEPRSGHWTLRIPSASFDTVMHHAEAIGQVRSVQSTSREVTAEYVDLQARLRNKQAEERRLMRHLDESAGDLDDILRVERELSRVRGEVEVYQGRLNVLTDLTSMSTVQVRVEEIKDYTPAATQEPGFGCQAQRAWAGSVSALGGFFEGVGLVVVTVTPWLVLVVPGVLLAWWGLRRVGRKPAA